MLPLILFYVHPFLMLLFFFLERWFLWCLLYNSSAIVLEALGLWKMGIFNQGFFFFGIIIYIAQWRVSQRLIPTHVYCVLRLWASTLHFFLFQVPVIPQVGWLLSSCPVPTSDFMCQYKICVVFVSLSQFIFLHMVISICLFVFFCKPHNFILEAE